MDIRKKCVRQDRSIMVARVVPANMAHLENIVQLRTTQYPLDDSVMGLLRHAQVEDEPM